MNRTIQLPGGETIEIKLYDVARFWSKVKPCGPDECWLWQAGRDHDGYGMFAVHQRKVLAHRFAYMVFVGPISDGLTLDHVAERGCRNRACVNPAHLEPVTHQENCFRASATRMHCKHGHEYTPENTYRRPSGIRECRACRKGYRQAS